MNTVITKIIDGHEVVKGFGKLAIDPEATKKIVAAEIESTTEFHAAKVVADKLISTGKLASEKKREAKKLHNSGKKSEAQGLWSDGEVLIRQCLDIENELKPLHVALKLKQQEMKKDHAVYFEPKRGEHAKTEAEINDLKEKVNSGQGFVCLDGSVLSDNRGAVFCEWIMDGANQRWGITKISSIGVDIPSDAILYGDLTDSQREEVDFQIERNAAADMTPSVRAVVLADKIETALNQAAVMRSKLEISGTSDDPLVASQEWFDDRKRELEVIYG